MTKNKQKPPPIKERIAQLEKVVFGLNNIIGLYVEYNNHTEEFQEFLKEKMKQKQAEFEKSKKEVK